MNVVEICISSFIVFISCLFFGKLSENNKKNKEDKYHNKATLDTLKYIAKEDARKSTDSIEDIKIRLNKYVRKT